MAQCRQNQKLAVKEEEVHGRRGDDWKIRFN